jgi:ribonuclease G
LPEWLVERGIGETRAALVEAGEIIEARIHLEGVARAGTGRQAVLKTIGPPAIASDGRDEYVLPKGAPGVTEGCTFIIEVTREKIPGSEPWKRPTAKVAKSIAIPLLEGEAVSFPSPDNPLDRAGWSDIVEEARSGNVRFGGGELRISPTPAMTLIDVDGHLPPEELSIRGAAEAAKAVRRLDIGGSIGIDLPTVRSKAARQEAAAAIDAVLPQPFERTAVNGFGFIQIVRPRVRGSLVELGQDRPSFEARAMLRQVALEPPGAKRLTAHPAVVSVLENRPDWLEALSRQIGGRVELRGDAARPMSGGYATSL